MTLCVFDIEVLLNAFICCLYNTKTKQKIVFEISERCNQYAEMVKYFLQTNHGFVGYNSGSYDSVIVNHIINSSSKYRNVNYSVITSECYDISDDIINHDGYRSRHLRWKNYFYGIDLLTMLYSKALRVSLKEMEITMCYRNVKEMDHHWSKPISLERLDSLIDYCFNDVGATTKLFALCKGDLNLRLGIEKEFGIQCTSKDGVGIGVDILVKFICEDMGISKGTLFSLVNTPSRILIKDLILPVVEFKTPAFQDVLRWFKTINISTEDAMNEVEGLLTTEKSKYQRKAQLGDMVHTFALGGIHSNNTPILYTTTLTHTLIDLDVASYYPALIIEWGIAPVHIRDAFLKQFRIIRTLRLDAKKNKNKQMDLTYKLAMNSASGHYKNKYSPFYSPESSLSMCINGQLMIAMLVEECEMNGIPCIMSNTDGATFNCPNEKLELLNEIRARWEKKCRMVLEEAVYEKMAVMSVADYVAFKKGYSNIRAKLHFHSPPDSIKLNEVPVLLKARNDEVSDLRETYIKEKGMFITSPRLGKGMDSLIVSKALQNYFGRGDTVESTILDRSNTIWDFIKFERVGKQFEVVWNQQVQQRTNRFYVSRKSPYLFKCQQKEVFDKKLGKTITINKEQSLLKGWGVELFNEYIDKPIQEYDINYRYYISQTNKIIEKIEPTQQELF